MKKIFFLVFLALSACKTDARLIEVAGAHLMSVAQNRAARIRDTFEYFVEDIRILSETTSVSDAVAEFSNAFSQSNAAGYAASEKYLALRTKYAIFEKYVALKNYSDVLIVGEKGDVVYAARNSKIVGQNFRDGLLAQTEVGRTSRHEAADVSLVDYEFFPPDGGYSMFACAWVSTDRIDGRGSIVFQLPTRRISAIMEAEAGLFRSGRAYALGTDGKYRTGSRSSVDLTQIGKGGIVTPHVELALSANEGFVKSYNVDNREVVAAFLPLRIRNLFWIVVVELSLNEARAIFM